MKQHVLRIIRQELRHRRRTSGALKWLALLGGVSVLGIGILTATVLYLSFGAMKQLADSPTGAKVIATGTQHAKATVEGLQSQTCQKALGGFLDPRVWLTEDLEAQWQKSVEACLAR